MINVGDDRKVTNFRLVCHKGNLHRQIHPGPRRQVGRRERAVHSEPQAENSAGRIYFARGFESIQGSHGTCPVGMGAGYAGGIVSAAVDGIRVAEAVAGG